MKKYFVFHMPVYDEIKIGDLVRSESFGHPAVKCTGFQDNGDIITDELDLNDMMGGSVFVIRKDKAVKLGKFYLCSTDIQKGDKLLCFQPDRTHKEDVEFVESVTDGVHTAYKVKNDKHGEFSTLSDNCFKVVGEISPQATWIYDGHEFDENEIRMGSPIKLKNRSCGHFH